MEETADDLDGCEVDMAHGDDVDRPVRIERGPDDPAKEDEDAGQ